MGLRTLLRRSVTFAFVLAVAACGRFVEIKSLVLAGVPSPDGKLMAYSYQTEPWGGPLADYSYRISILPSDSYAKPWEGGEIIWAGGELDPLYDSDSRYFAPPPQHSVPQQLSTASLPAVGRVVALPWRAR